MDTCCTPGSAAKAKAFGKEFPAVSTGDLLYSPPDMANPPFNKYWGRLTDTQQGAANNLGWFKGNWDMSSSDKPLDKEWDALSLVEKACAASLGHTAMTWDNLQWMGGILGEETHVNFYDEFDPRTHTRDENYVFTNFFPHEFTWRGRIWKTAEHAFQAAKYMDHPKYGYNCPLTALDHVEAMANLNSPGEAYNYSRANSTDYDPENWATVKIAVMKDILVDKFKNEPLKSKLTSTGHKILVEDSGGNDCFWGNGLLIDNLDGCGGAPYYPGHRKRVLRIQAPSFWPFNQVMYVHERAHLCNKLGQLLMEIREIEPEFGHHKINTFMKTHLYARIEDLEATNPVLRGGYRSKKRRTKKRRSKKRRSKKRRSKKRRSKKRRSKKRRYTKRR